MLRLAVLVPILAALGCATGPRPERKYPARRPGCSLSVTFAAQPDVAAWDDIGVVQVGCYIDESEVACMHRLRVEACRMGGDLLYDVPKKASRPGEREMTMRAKVAHTRETGAAKKPDEPLPSAPGEPVIPIGAPAPPPEPASPAPAPADAGATG